MLHRADVPLGLHVRDGGRARRLRRRRKGSADVYQPLRDGHLSSRIQLVSVRGPSFWKLRLRCRAVQHAGKARVSLRGRRWFSTKRGRLQHVLLPLRSRSVAVRQDPWWEDRRSGVSRHAFVTEMHSEPRLSVHDPRRVHRRLVGSRGGEARGRRRVETTRRSIGGSRRRRRARTSRSSACTRRCRLASRGRGCPSP